MAKKFCVHSFQFALKIKPYFRIGLNNAIKKIISMSRTLFIIIDTKPDCVIIKLHKILLTKVFRPKLS